MLTLSSSRLYSSSFNFQEILDNFNLSRNQQIDALNTAIENEFKLDDMLLCRIDIAEILKVLKVVQLIKYHLKLQGLAVWSMDKVIQGPQKFHCIEFV